MNLKQKIIDFYEYADQGNTVKTFSPLKIYLLYPLTIMDGNLLNLISGVTTGLSINIFTGFISFEGKGMLDFLMWIIRLISAIIVNYCIIRLAIYCTILRIEANEESDNKLIQRDRTVAYRKSLLNHYNDYYNHIKKYTLRGLLWLIVLVFCVIVIPVSIFICNNRGQIGGLLNWFNSTKINNAN